MSEKDYKSVDIAVQISSSLETMSLYQEYMERKWSYQQDRSGPLLTIGKIGDRPICVAPLIHVVEGIRVMYVEATSPLIDWTLIDNWVREVTGKPDIRIQCDPVNLCSDLNHMHWHKHKDTPTTPL